MIPSLEEIKKRLDEVFFPYVGQQGSPLQKQAHAVIEGIYEELKPKDPIKPKITMNALHEILIDALHVRLDERGAMVWEIDASEVAAALKEAGMEVEEK